MQMTRQELRDGYVELMRDLYEPEAYFERLEGLYLRDRFRFAVPRQRYWRRHPWNWLQSQTINLVRFLYL